jgi:dynein heavy chain
MNSVVTQELTRYNGLIKTIRSSLNDLKLAIKGEVLLSSELEVALKQIRQGYVPELWLAKSYPSLKSLGSYIKDLSDRLDFFQKWIDTKGQFPKFYWINKFFFTQGFMTGALQNYARAKELPIDKLALDFEVIHDEDRVEVPAEGILVKGMNMEGFKWNAATQLLAESDPKILFSDCPMMWFKPVLEVDFKHEGVYKAPLYRTMERKGTLATTGHSTNFVLKVSLPTDVAPSHWTKRGAAMICSLTD